MINSSSLTQNPVAFKQNLLAVRTLTHLLTDHTASQMVTLLSALDNFGENTWKKFLIYVQGESFVKCHREGKNFLQNCLKVQEVGMYDSQHPEGNSPWFKFPWGAVTSQIRSAKCVLGHVLPVHLLLCAASIPRPSRATLCGPIFSSMGTYSKEQGHCLSLHWEASTPYSSPGLHHSLQKATSFFSPQ